MFALRRQHMAHLQGLDLSFYAGSRVGRVVTRVTTDVDVLNDLFSSGLVNILGDVLVLLFILAIMFSFSPQLTLIMLGAMPFVILTSMVFRRTVTESYRRIRVAIARINAYLQEHITGIVVLQLFNGERRSGREFEAVNREHMNAYKKAITAYGWFYPVVEFISMVALAGILTWGGVRVRAGTLTLGVVVVGHTGAGKTTMISLLLRFYDVQQGAIRLGGIDLREFDPLALRRHFGVVLQDPYLFTGTLEENIRLGTESIRIEDVEAAAEQVNLIDFIRGLPSGFAHSIRERGS